jgi:very-short-patch-repair endonuclease
LSKKQPDWVRLYRRELDAIDIVETWGIPAVGPEQALIDCLAVMAEDDADRLVDAELTRSVSIDGVALLRKRSPGRHGNGDVVRQIRCAALGAASEPERLLAREFARRHFAIAANVPIGPFVADFYDERARLVVEVDGREFHSEQHVFRSDRRRQNWMVLRDIMVLRYAAADVFSRVDSVAAEVITIARRRRKSLG